MHVYLRNHRSVFQYPITRLCPSWLQMWTSAVSSSHVPRSVWTHLAAIDVHAGKATGLPEMAVPAKVFHLLLRPPLLPPPARQQWVVTQMRVNEQRSRMSVCNLSRSIKSIWRKEPNQLRGPLLLLVRAMPLSTRTVSNNALRLVPTPDRCLAVWAHVVRLWTPSLG